MVWLGAPGPALHKVTASSIGYMRTLRHWVSTYSEIEGFIVKIFLAADETSDNNNKILFVIKGWPKLEENG